MKKLAISAFLFALMTACGQENNTSTNPSLIDVAINATASAVDEKHIQISGSTNLPDQTELNITVEDSKSEWRSQTEAVVSGGTFFIQKLEIAYGLTPDKYEIRITQLVPPLQPELVKQVVGDHGEYLTGELVSDSEMGKSASFSIYLTHGSEHEISLAKEGEEKEVRAVTDKVKATISAGLAMEKYRTDESVDKCFELMRKHQTDARSIREEADKLKFEYGHIRVGAMELRECVSCLSTAKDACKRSAEALEKKI